MKKIEVRIARALRIVFTAIPHDKRVVTRAQRAMFDRCYREILGVLESENSHFDFVDFALSVYRDVDTAYSDE